MLVALASSPLVLRGSAVSLAASDASGTSSFAAAGHWNNAQAPSAADDYFTAGFLLRSPASGASNYFAGNSLSLDFSASNPLVGLTLKYPSSGSVRVDDLRLHGGAIFNGQGGTMSVYGNITVLANSFLDPQAGGRVLAIYAPIHGAAGSTIGVRAASGSAGGVVQVLGDGSGYAGNWYIWGAGDTSPSAILQVGNGGTNGSLGTGTVTDDNSLLFDRSDSFTVANVISGPGSVTMAGAGTMTLAASNSYSGATIVSAGRLVLGTGASINQSALLSLNSGTVLDVSAGNGYSLAPRQTLAGSGTVIGPLAAGANTSISPGDASSGTLTVDGALSLGPGNLRFDLASPGIVGGPNDLLAVNGDVTLAPGITLDLVFPGSAPVEGTYTLCQCTGKLTGEPTDLSAQLSSGIASFALDTSATPNRITVTISATNTPPATNAPPIIKVFLEGGQSNADGRALTNGLPSSLLSPQNDVPLYYYLTGGAANTDGTLGTLTTLRPGCSALGGGTTFGPEITFGRTLADYFAVTNHIPTNNVMVALIKYAHGGTSLASNWAANGTSTTTGDGPDYVIFQKVVSAGLARLASAYPNSSLEVSGMFWVQGETDIDNGSATSAAYGTNLVGFIRDVRATYASRLPYGTNLPFFLSRISQNQTVYSNPSDPDYPNYVLLRAGEAYAASSLSNVFMLDIDAPQFSTLTPYASPGLHFDTGGQLALGTSFAQAVIAALPRPRLGTPIRVGNGWQLAFTGPTGFSYTVQRAFSLAGPWTALTNLVIGASASATYQETIAAGPSAFYRVTRP